MRRHDKIIEAALKDREESLEFINTPNYFDIFIRQEDEAEPMMIRSFTNISNAPAGTLFTFYGLAYMKTTDGFWVSYDNRTLTDFDFFIFLLRAVDDEAVIRLVYRPEPHLSEDRTRVFEEE